MISDKGDATQTIYRYLSFRNSLSVIAPNEPPGLRVYPIDIDLSRSVQYIVLHHENNVEYDRHIGQSQLDRITRYTRPITLQT